MPRGRPPKSPKLKILSGNPGKRPVKSAPKPSGRPPPCPAWLPAAAKALWKQLAAELGRLGLLTRLDGRTLARYCYAEAEVERTAEVLDREGDTVECGGQLQPHPVAKRQEWAMKTAATLGEKLGLDALSRQKLHVTDEPADALAEFLESS
jgi:P27 family predicted phage terminase small subunit